MKSLRIVNVAPRTSAPYKCVSFGFIFDDHKAGRERERKREKRKRERERERGKQKRVAKVELVIVMGR